MKREVLNVDKICFVIMGFGKKTDFETGRTLDLDKTYKNIIQPAVIKAGYQCIRADEIQDSGIIDRSMYALLIKSELVIADISTYNPNAIYELGIRHAVKPFSTIILKEKQGSIPFDLDHTRIFMYAHLGEDIGFDEAKRCQDHLVILINSIQESPRTDSPLYEFINIDPPVMAEVEYKSIIKELAEREKHIFAIVEQAKDEMTKGDFQKASSLWEKASSILPNEQYFIQQHALCRYKSKYPSEKVALTDALQIIQNLDAEGNTNDPETLGITGAINRRLYQSTYDINYLDRAIEYYGKGFKVRADYYNGENYALCLDMKAKVQTDPLEKIYLRVEAKKTREKIIQHLESISEEEIIYRPDKKWIYATLSTCYLALHKDNESDSYKTRFEAESIEDWERETFKDSQIIIKELMKN